MYPRESVKNPWEGAMKPFKIFGSVYFTGTYQASSHLIDTGDGLILIDTGYANTVYLLVQSIWELGFRPEQIRYIVHTHWHGDHTEATRPLLALTQAKTVIGIRDDKEVAAHGYFQPDLVVSDGQTLTLGNTTIHFVETPGHTVGTISLFFDVQEGGRICRAGMFGGAGANSLAREFPTTYAGCREQYLSSLARLRREPVEVFLGNHCWNNDTKVKYRVMQESGGNPFIDSDCREWNRFLDFCEERLKKLMASDNA